MSLTDKEAAKADAEANRLKLKDDTQAKMKETKKKEFGLEKVWISE